MLRKKIESIGRKDEMVMKAQLTSKFHAEYQRVLHKSDFAPEEYRIV
jgi:hypothetical protein